MQTFYYNFLLVFYFVLYVEMIIILLDIYSIKTLQTIIL